MKSDLERKGRESSLSSSATALSLVGGIIIILSGSIIPWLFFANYYHQTPNMSGRMMDGSGMMMMGWLGPGLMGTWSFFPFFSPIVLISGIMVVIGGIMTGKRPQEATGWGIIALVFSVLALTAMGLSIVGSTLGIIGGIIFLSGTF